MSRVFSDVCTQQQGTKFKAHLAGRHISLATAAALLAHLFVKVNLEPQLPAALWFVPTNATASRIKGI